MFANKAHTWRGTTAWLLGLGTLFCIGVVTAMTASLVHRSEVLAFELIGRFPPVILACAVLGGLIIGAVLFKYAEVALALFFLVGLIKGDPNLPSPPVDLTVFVAGVVIAATAVRLIRGHRELVLPREYLFYVPLVALMILSLAYTPDRGAGLDKTLRFLCLTSIGIVAPFVIFDSITKIRRFMVTMLIGGVGLGLNSLTQLSGSDRLVSPSGLNTELGLACAVAIVILWTLLFPEWPMFKRILAYPVIGVLAVALVGSGARTANVSAALCVILGAFLCRKLWSDLIVAGSLGVLALPFVWIPQASYDYLASLTRPHDAMDTRRDLMALGVRMFGEHPLFGVGIQGFRFHSPNPLTYNFPHNVFLELGSELGICAVLAYLGLLVFSFIQIFRELRRGPGAKRNVAVTTLMLMIMLTLEAMVSGDINDLRLMWCVLGLPFVLRHLGEEAKDALKLSPFLVSRGGVTVEPEFVVET